MAPNDQRDLYLMVGQIQEGVRGLQSNMASMGEAVKENSEAIVKLSATLGEITPIAQDWAATKKRGLIALAGVGATGLAAGYGFKPAAAWIKTVFLGG